MSFSCVSKTPDHAASTKLRLHKIHGRFRKCYKQDRLKTTPHSDVIILHRKDTRRASRNDFVICDEAKQKATEGVFDPIKKAVEGFMADNTGRLARTLVWLREKAIDSDSRSAIEYPVRFTQAIMVPYRKHYKAVAIVDRALLDEEISRALDFGLGPNSL